VPEAYAIEKDGAMYYAFYALEPANSAGKPRPATWKGEIELRGLASKTYHVTDYVNRKDYGTVVGPVAKLRAEFTGSLLLEVR
jgi:alpha-galactosidase